MDTQRLNSPFQPNGSFVGLFWASVGMFCGCYVAGLVPLTLSLSEVRFICMEVLHRPLWTFFTWKACYLVHSSKGLTTRFAVDLCHFSAVYNFGLKYLCSVSTPLYLQIQTSRFLISVLKRLNFNFGSRWNSISFSVICLSKPAFIYNITHLCQFSLRLCFFSITAVYFNYSVAQWKTNS